MQRKDDRPLTPRFILRLANPNSWPASVCPALFAEVWCLLSGLALSAIQNIAFVIVCVLMQSSVNTLNDYMDYVKGADTREDNVAVEDAVLVYENVNPMSVLLLGVGFLAAAALIGIAASISAGFLPLIIGIIGGLVVVFYSCGPTPISYLPAGEMVSGFVMGGLIPLGIAAASDNRLHPAILLWSLPFIIGIALIMMSNNGSDIEKDERSGRKTLPVMLGRGRTLKLYRVLVIIWMALITVFPIILVGKWGIVSPVFWIITAGGLFRFLLTDDLDPGNRIKRMKTIAAANLLGNEAYILAIAVYLAFAA
ncbi:MAG: UbiA family prenyltransferase [Lachnospiraceae bacterium]|nr:UbiA family prenyltransferase [Lachnospiraceae bacterium]